MSSTLDVSSAVPLRGAQRPRIAHLPEHVASSGDDAIEVARLAGLELDPWQQFVLRHSLGERPDGKWSAFEVGVMVERQNGKGGLLEARELAGLFLLGERLIIHTAHLFPTSLEALERLAALIENTPEFSRLLKNGSRGIRRSHGEEGIDLKTGQRIRFKTRTKGGGRGFTADCLILDEAMEIPRTAISATMPTLSAVPNPQIWYTGSAVDQQVHEHGEVFAKIRQRGHSGDAGRLMYAEWSPAIESVEAAMDPAVATDREVWAQANPALGIRISDEYIADEQASLDARSFAVERLGVGDWPEITDGRVTGGLDLERWLSLVDPASEALDPVAFVFDVTPDRAWASIGVAGWRADGLMHVEVVEHRKGTRWLPARLVELCETHDCLAPACDQRGPAGALVSAIENLGVDVEPISVQEHVEACGQLFDMVDEGTLRHLGQPELTAAVRVATKRPLGGGETWAWSRRNSTGDISPLVAVTLAAGRVAGDTSASPFVEVVR